MMYRWGSDRKVRKSTKGIHIIHGLMLLSLVCMLMPAGASAQETVRIAYLGDFSSLAKRYSISSFAATQIAVREINAQGGLLGRKIELLKSDGGNSPEKHHNNFLDLVSKQNVVAVIGGTGSHIVMKASEASKKTKVLYLVSLGNSRKIVVENGHPYVFLLQPNSIMEEKAIAVLTALLPYNTYAWSGPDYSWGRSRLVGLKKQLRTLAPDITIGLELWHDLATHDFSHIIQSFKESNADALLVGAWGNDLMVFTKQAQEKGIFRQFPCVGLFSFEQYATLGKDADAAIWGFGRAPFFYLIEKYAPAKRLYDTYLKEMGTPPLDNAFCAYDAVLVWKKAVLRAKTFAPNKTAQVLKGITFYGSRGHSYIRPIDGQMDCSSYVGKYTYVPEHPYPIMKPLIEVKAAQTMMYEDEVIAIRNAQSK